MVWRKMESEDLRWLSKWQSPSDKSSHHHYGPTLYLRYQPRSFGGDHHSATSTNPLYALLLTACLFVIYAPTHICCTVCVLVLLATLPEGTWEDGTPLEEHTGARIRHISIDHPSWFRWWYQWRGYSDDHYDNHDSDDNNLYHHHEIIKSTFMIKMVIIINIKMTLMDKIKMMIMIKTKTMTSGRETQLRSPFYSPLNSMWQVTIVRRRDCDDCDDCFHSYKDKDTDKYNVCYFWKALDSSISNFILAII